MVRTFLKVYMELGSSFLFLQEKIKDIIIITHLPPILNIVPIKILLSLSFSLLVH